MPQEHPCCLGSSHLTRAIPVWSTLGPHSQHPASEPPEYPFHEAPWDTLLLTDLNSSCPARVPSSLSTLRHPSSSKFNFSCPVRVYSLCEPWDTLVHAHFSFSYPARMCSMDRALCIKPQALPICTQFSFNYPDRTSSVQSAQGLLWPMSTSTLAVLSDHPLCKEL